MWKIYLGASLFCATGDTKFEFTVRRPPNVFFLKFIISEGALLPILPPGAC